MNESTGSVAFSDVPYREATMPPVCLDIETGPDGAVLMRSSHALQAFDPNIPRSFLAQAGRHPDKTLYAQRRRLPDGKLGEWDRVTFTEAARQVKSIGQWLIDRGLQQRDTVLIITGNSIAHALVRLGALAAGVTACPISANYALMGGNYERLRYVIDLVKPKVVFAETGGPVARALQHCDLGDTIVISRDAAEFGENSVSFETLLATAAGPETENRIGQLDVDEHAVYMLTSGSTGMPKAVIQTQRMLSTNMHQAFQTLGKVSGWDDVMLDWLPWSHVSGAFNLLAAAVFGGSLYIDEGKPVPGLFNETIRNLREISVPYFCNVPAGYAVLIEALEKDELLRKRFFAKLRMLLYGGAGLPQHLLDRLQALAVSETGHRIFMTTGYGATESASGCMAIYFDTDKVGIGLPLPGLEVKLVPVDDRYEIRLRGDNIMPGYLNNPQSTAAVFDDQGYYRTGDAACFHDPADPAQGLYFAGRLAEEFKLGTGTWVYAGVVRAKLIEALSPVISDLLLCGIGKDYLGVLGVPRLAGLREVAGQAEGELAELTAHPRVMSFLTQALATYNAAHPSGSTRIARFAFMRALPDAGRHELSDKGTLNQRIASENRASEIEDLYADTPPAHVLIA